MRLIEVRRPVMAPGQPKLQAVLETQQPWQYIGLLGGLCHQQADQVVGQQTNPERLSFISVGVLQWRRSRPKVVLMLRRSSSTFQRDAYRSPRAFLGAWVAHSSVVTSTLELTLTSRTANYRERHRIVHVSASSGRSLALPTPRYDPDIPRRRPFLKSVWRL
jgi:hypothetical protein